MYVEIPDRAIPAHVLLLSTVLHSWGRYPGGLQNAFFPRVRKEKHVDELQCSVNDCSVDATGEQTEVLLF